MRGKINDKVEEAKNSEKVRSSISRRNDKVGRAEVMKW